MQNAIPSLGRAVVLLASLGLAGCASKYVTPMRGADLRELGLTGDSKRALTDLTVQQALDKQPLASFPTGLAVVRIQSPGYSSQTAQGWGTGRYSIVTTRDIEQDAQFERLGKLPRVTAVAPVNRLLFTSGRLDSDLELRHAAALLHADVLLIYTLDTTFYIDDPAVPLSVISLGLSPNRCVRATTTASAVFMGTHNGYIYGLAEATAHNDRISSAWTDGDAIDVARRRTETEAFGKLVMELERTWTGILLQHACAPRSDLKRPAGRGIRVPSPAGVRYETTAQAN